MSTKTENRIWPLRNRLLKGAVTSEPIGIFRNFFYLNILIFDAGHFLFYKIVPKSTTEFRNKEPLVFNASSLWKFRRETIQLIFNTRNSKQPPLISIFDFRLSLDTTLRFLIMIWHTKSLSALQTKVHSTTHTPFFSSYG